MAAIPGSPDRFLIFEVQSRELKVVLSPDRGGAVKAINSTSPAILVPPSQLALAFLFNTNNANLTVLGKLREVLYNKWLS